MRHFGSGRVVQGSPNKDKDFGNWSLIYVLPIKPSAGQLAGRSPLLATKVKKAEVSCLHHKFKFLHSGLLNLTSAYEWQRVAAVTEVIW